MSDMPLVAPDTVVTGKGDSAPVSLEGMSNRVFLIILNITEIVEQESIELSVFGSPDGQTWETKPLITFPQKFYPGETPLLLDLAARPEITAIRAHWEVNRWGRGSEQPMFKIGVMMREVPAEMLQQHGG